LCLAVTACGGDDGDPAPASGGAGGTSAACGGRGETFSAGMRKTGEEDTFDFVLLSADPAPPQLFDNVWRVRVEDAGSPVEKAELSVKTWMPDHEHGSPKQTGIKELSPGEYELSPVNLFMPGYWEIEVHASLTPKVDSVKFSFCVGE
jgi:hypothetical protein